MRARVNLWKTMIRYINVFHKYRTTKIITRSQLIHAMKDYGKIDSIDTYRNYLYIAGYLGYATRPNGKKWLGHYIIINEIPVDLQISDIYSIPTGTTLANTFLSNIYSESTDSEYILHNSTNKHYIYDKAEKTIKEHEFISQEEMEI